MSTDFQGLPDERFYPRTENVRVHFGREVTRFQYEGVPDLRTWGAQRISGGGWGGPSWWMNDRVTDDELNDELRRLTDSPNAMFWWPERSAA